MLPQHANKLFSETKLLRMNVERMHVDILRTAQKCDQNRTDSKDEVSAVDEKLAKVTESLHRLLSKELEALRHEISEGQSCSGSRLAELDKKLMRQRDEIKSAMESAMELVKSEFKHNLRNCSNDSKQMIRQLRGVLDSGIGTQQARLDQCQQEMTLYVDAIEQKMGCSLAALKDNGILKSIQLTDTMSR